MTRIGRLQLVSSRWLSRRLLGPDLMLCAQADWGRWRLRHVFNAAFLDRGHCAAAADWESAQIGRALSLSDLGMVDRLRGRGL